MPTRVAQGIMASPHFCRIAAAGAHTMAISIEGDLFSWGSNVHGQLGLFGRRPLARISSPPLQNLPARASERWDEDACDF